MTENEWLFFSGGPKDGQVLLGSPDEEGLLKRLDTDPAALYRVSDDTHYSNGAGTFRVAIFVGDEP